MTNRMIEKTERAQRWVFVTCEGVGSSYNISNSLIRFFVLLDGHHYKNQNPPALLLFNDHHQ